MKKLLVSFSGGLTSAYMTYRLVHEYGDEYDLRFVFANTGQEDERTLVFVDRCDREWGLGVVWLEAVVHHGIRQSSGHKIVDFATASRRGEPFEEVIKKYGIPNKPFPHCTRELKERPIKSYRESIGWGKCLNAIGIRADEPDRIGGKPNIVYPLAHWFPTVKSQINDWWEDQPFSLGLKSYEGNCTWCWKKSLSKLIRIATERPEVFEFPRRMEDQYAMAGPSGQPQVFFRDHRSANDILAMADCVQPGLFIERPDEDSGCSESCEAF